MSSLSSGVGTNIGGPSVPTPRDVETSAWTQANKAALGIVADSIEQSFVELNPRYSNSYLGGFGYKTTAENPLLDHPLETLMLTQSFDKSTSEDWLLTYQNLVNELPPDLLTRVINQGNKPLEERNLSFIGFDNLLLTAAKVLTQIENLAQPAEPNSLEETRTAFNQLLPFVALKGVINNTNEITQAAQVFLAGQGANYPYFDGFNNLLNQLQTPLASMALVNNSLNQTTDGQLGQQAVTAATKAAQQFATIGSQLERISLGPDLQIMKSTLFSLEMIATSLSLPNTNTAPLFIALSMASIGVFTSESPLGMLGNSFEAVTNLSQSLLSAVMPPNNKSGNDFLALMVPLSLTALVGVASLTLNSGLGIFPQTNPQGLESARFFTFETASLLAASSGIMETVYQEMISASGGNQEAQNLGGSTLALLANLMIISSQTANGSNQALRLIENLANYLNEGLVSANSIQQTGTQEGSASTEIAIQTSSLALQSTDYQGFLETLNSFLENIGTSSNALQTDLTNINQATNAMMIGLGNSQQPLTQMVNII